MKLIMFMLHFPLALYTIICRTFKAIGVVAVFLFTAFLAFISLYLIVTTYLKVVNKSAFSTILTLREGVRWIDCLVLFILAICMGIIIFAITVYILEKLKVNISDRNLRFFGLFTLFFSLLIFLMFVFDSNQFSVLASVISIIAISSNLTKIKSGPIIKDDLV